MYSSNGLSDRDDFLLKILAVENELQNLEEISDFQPLCSKFLCGTLVDLLQHTTVPWHTNLFNQCCSSEIVVLSFEPESSLIVAQAQSKAV